jgi:hypothetical protein
VEGRTRAQRPDIRPKGLAGSKTQTLPARAVGRERAELGSVCVATGPGLNRRAPLLLASVDVFPAEQCALMLKPDFLRAKTRNSLLLDFELLTAVSVEM